MRIGFGYDSLVSWYGGNISKSKIKKASDWRLLAEALTAQVVMKKIDFEWCELLAYIPLLKWGTTGVDNGP